ncbi:hypothetical protein [Photobacterium leiognathi]|uniref:hypothetical protein n=1 Tax=Photobacterium leiognathi TaxID=553611 RepID=UPI0029827DAA|nr:hypothetical protein [Photobacterium leiognathi]
MKNTYLIVNKTRHNTGDLVNLSFCVPISVDNDDRVEYSEGSIKYLSLPSFDVRDSEINHYVRAISSELHSLLVNFAINDDGEIACNNIKHLYKDKNLRLLPTSTDTDCDAVAVAPTIVSKLTDSCKVFSYKRKPKTNTVFFSFSDNEQPESLISIIDTGLSPFKRTNHDGFAVFKNNELIHSTIKEVSITRKVEYSSNSFVQLRSAIGSLNDLSIAPMFY